MADWWGRKVPIAVGGGLMIVGGFLGAFANGYGSKLGSSYVEVWSNISQVYCGGRFILGFGNSLAQMASPVLLTELCHPQHRARVTAIYNCLWNLGALCK